MPYNFIPVEDVAKEWLKDSVFVDEYNALDREFILAAAAIRVKSPMQLKPVGPHVKAR